jgi:ParB family chromosome partitioning protein
MTHQQTAESVGRSRAAVTNLLRLLTLNHDVRQMLEEGRMDMGHARALLALTGKAQSDAARQVVDKGLSVRETEQLVRRLTERPHAPKAPRAKDPDIRALEEKLADRLGARVVIQHASSGKGRLVIDYHSMDELDGILARIK